jgi:pimeloyl-ACP methyl ester carboxylesterase
MRRNAFLEMLWPAHILRKSNKDELAAHVSAMVGRDLASQPAIIMKQLKALGRHDVSGRLKELAGIPTFVLSGDEDPIALPRYGQALAEGIPGARFEVLSKAAHAFTIQRAEDVNERLLTFLGGVEQKRPSQPASFLTQNRKLLNGRC